MSEQLPYNDEQWDDLPLPDNNQSWEKMEVLLEKDKERRRIIPFWFWRSAGLLLLLAGLAIGGWFVVSGGSKNQQVSKVDDKEKVEDKVKVEREHKKKTVVESNTKEVRKDSYEEMVSDTLHLLKKKQDTLEGAVIKIAKPGQEHVTEKTVVAKQGKKVVSKQKQATVRRTQNIASVPEKKVAKNGLTKDRKASISEGRQPSKPEQNENNTTPGFDRSSNKKNNVDSAGVKDTAAVKPVMPVVANDEKKPKVKKASALIWSAGIGLQQSIAVAGQQSSNYNYNGKRGTLSDHLPSVNLRLQKAKWYLQAEAAFSSPQPTENFSFSQATKYDSASVTLTTEKFFIDKIYYHQFPVSINYAVLPNLSVGAGGIYSVLAGAVTTKEVNSKNVVNGAETKTRMLAPVKGYKDSFLYKTTAGLLLQTDYHWKRFSLGLRYTKNLQPFIKYTRPNGDIVDEKTSALQAILRFRLWKK